MKAKFRVGQRVRVIKTDQSPEYLYADITGIITYVSKNTDSINYGIHPISGVTERLSEEYSLIYNNDKSKDDDEYCNGHETILNHFIGEKFLELVANKIDKDGNLV